MTRPQHRMKAALEALSEAAPLALPEKVLRDHVAARVRPVATDDEWKAVISLLVTGNRIAVLPQEDGGDDEARWLITEAGRSWLITH